MLLVRHEGVSVVRLAAQHACDARPAYALLARHRYIDAVRGKDLKHRLVWRYVKSLAGAGELDFKALVLGARGRQIGRAHVRTPVTNAHLVCRLLLEKQTTN